VCMPLNLQPSKRQYQNEKSRDGERGTHRALNNHCWRPFILPVLSVQRDCWGARLGHESWFLRGTGESTTLSSQDGCGIVLRAVVTNADEPGEQRLCVFADRATPTWKIGTQYHVNSNQWRFVRKMNSKKDAR
jgi:hypothetical protein